MPLEGVPWMVAGAEHSADIGRLLAYHASSGKEGITSPDDMAVLAANIPNNTVIVTRGAVASLNKNDGQQTYLSRNTGPEVVALTQQGSGGTRYDLVALVIEDPQYPGSQAPADPLNGPYERFRVYENVSAATRRLSQVAPNQTGYALALITRPASSNTIVQSHILDLRKLANPQVERHQRMLNVPGNVPVAMGTAERVFPQNASWNIEIPVWANRVQLVADWAGVSMIDNGAVNARGVGIARVALGNILGEATNWYAEGDGRNTRNTQALMDAIEAEVPASVRGTVQSLQARAQQAINTGVGAVEAGGTAVRVEATFYEVPNVPLS